MRFLSACELADRLGVKADTVRAWARRGWIPCMRASRRPLMFDPNEVESTLRSRAACKDFGGENNSGC